jgi:hypothetical protein
MTAGPGPRVAALLDSLRPVAEEILVALDDRADVDVQSDVATVADRVVRYPYAEPVDRPLPWLFEQCRGSWALFVDDDEIPSLALIEALPRLCADDAVVHYSLPRRWLYPDSSTFLDDAPWRPDYALRLVRTDRRLVRFSDEFHRPILSAGPGRFVEQPLWHADTILRPFELRREKTRRYEQSRPGVRVGGRALNFAFYLPEQREDARLTPVPADERDHVEAVLNARRPTGPERATVGAVSREAIDRLWPVSEHAAQAGDLELLEQPTAFIAGERRTLDVRVRNTGSAVWPWGTESRPEIRVGARWFEAGGDELPGVEIHTDFPADIAPGGADVVPVHVRAPDRAGAYRIEIDLVHEHEGRFGSPVGCDAVVLRRRRIAVVGDDDAVGHAAAVLETMPELEIVRLRRSPSPRLEGYPEAPDLRAYLFDDAPPGWIGFASTFAWRSLRLRMGPTPRRAAACVDAVRGCELVVVAGPDGPAQRREEWATRMLGALGVPLVRGRDVAHLLAMPR